MRVGYQGGDGAYSHIAATRHFKTDESNVECVAFPAFAPMLKAVKSGDVACALLPIENSIAGLDQRKLRSHCQSRPISDGAKSCNTSTIA